MPHYVGIDLGTTTSALAVLREDGQPEIVPNAQGERLTPSVVYFGPQQEIQVGTPAKDSGVPGRTVYCIKRKMDDPDHTLEFDGRQWTPAEVSALILAKLARECSATIGELDQVVITVPALFNELARKSTLAAAEMAGIHVKRLVNEPTAAALYYAQRFGVQGRVMVYDLGGGTLDITILEIDNEGMRLLLSEGARHLGGADIDEVVLDIYSAQFRKELGTELYTNEDQRKEALKASEGAKMMLSKLKQVSGTIDNTKDGAAQINLSRDIFEASIDRIILRSQMLVEQALDRANLTTRDIDHVVLVGGSTRIPRIQEMLEKLFGTPPHSCGNVDECVALGAALFARHSTRVKEVCNQSYGTLALIEDATTGMETYENSIVIPKNTRIPCSHTETYITSEDDERSIEVEITQGEDTNPSFVDVIGKITLQVPPGRPAGCAIKVTYRYDENQRVHALIQDIQSGRSKEITINYKGKGVLSEQEVAQAAAHIATLSIG